MPTPAEILGLATDEAFVQRVTLAFAGAAHSLLTAPDPPIDAQVRLNQLKATRAVADLTKARKLVDGSLALILGAPELLASGGDVTDENLAAAVGRIVTALGEYVTLGGSLE